MSPGSVGVGVGVGSAVIPGLLISPASVDTLRVRTRNADMQIALKVRIGSPFIWFFGLIKTVKRWEPTRSERGA